MKYWTREQYEVFSRNVRKSATKPAFDILFYTGMRSGELLALTPADILPDKRISINKNYAKVKGEEPILIPKTAKSNRNMAIPDFLYDDLFEYISKLGGIGKDDRIFYFTKSHWKRRSNGLLKKQDCQTYVCMTSGIHTPACSSIWVLTFWRFRNGSDMSLQKLHWILIRICIQKKTQNWPGHWISCGDQMKKMLEIISASCYIIHRNSATDRRLAANLINYKNNRSV